MTAPEPLHADDGARRPRSGIACAGNWIVDYIHGIERWPQVGDLVRIRWQSSGIGGGAANVATDLRALGAPFPVCGIGCIGDDAAGRMVLAHCEAAGLPTDRFTVLQGVPTGQTHVMTLEGANRTFFYQGGANDAFDLEHVNLQAIAGQGYRIFYLGYLALLARLDSPGADGQTGAARLLRQAKSEGLVTCVDVVSEETQRLRQVAASALVYTDYLVINEVEAGRVGNAGVRNLDGTLNLPALEQAAANLIRAGVGKAVIVHAPEGGLWYDKNHQALWQTATGVASEDVVSTVGAGDAFCAGVLYGVHEGWEPQTILRRAHLTAAACLGGTTATDAIPSMASVCERDRHWQEAL